MANNGKHWNPIMVDNNNHHHQLKKNDLTINHNSQLNLIQSFLPIHSHNDHYHGIRQQYQSYTIIPKLNPIPITISLSNEPFIPLQSELMADSYNDGLKNNKKQQQNFSCQLYNTQTRLYGILRPQWWWWQCLFNDYQQPQQQQQQQTNHFGQQSTEDFVHDTNHWNAYFKISATITYDDIMYFTWMGNRRRVNLISEDQIDNVNDHDLTDAEVCALAVEHLTVDDDADNENVCDESEQLGVVNSLINRYMDVFEGIGRTNLVEHSIELKTNKVINVKPYPVPYAYRDEVRRIKKCEFAKQRIEYLGFVIQGGSIQPSFNKTKCIHEFPVPKCRKDLRSFLGLVNSYRSLVPNYAEKSFDLYELLKQKNRFLWKNNHQRTFENLKVLMSSQPVDPNSFIQINHLWYFRHAGRDRLCIPQSRVKEILQLCHDKMNHIGQHKCLDIVFCRFYWPKWRNDVKQWIRKCACNVKKDNDPRPAKQPMCATDILNLNPFEKVDSDLQQTTTRSR
ncbi:hypothetical protein HUG17_6361 [Dermatophagoides farinae]|uniref:RNA-directed DNA polymerase n=1 Tax=Dermatophagoides farinae TaxID=6954 RepID=A0A9D4P5L5_DERFA|nr:hypothetical protein HUG17_6361 [Dermatophagoides farinae]